MFEIVSTAVHGCYIWNIYGKKGTIYNRIRNGQISFLPIFDSR